MVFFGAAFLVAFLVFTFGSPLSMDERNRRGEGSTPPHSRGAYFFFFEPPFLAAFFFAAIWKSPLSVQDWTDPLVNVLGDEGLDILGVG